ncbi:MAG: T9SS type A sorting domain-containing protein [Vicingaceae bacterium]
MRQLSFLLFFLCFLGSISAQDHLVSPMSNPALFPEFKLKQNNDKLLVTEDTFVYRYDTLSLPFIDDFSEDHFPKRVSNTSSPRVTDTLVYQILIRGVPYKGSRGFVTDTTGYILYDMNDSIVQAVANPVDTIDFFDLSNYPPMKQTLLVYPAYNVYDTIGGNNLDTIPLMPEFTSDSLRFYIVDADSNDFYTNRSAYLNTTFGIDPPSIGVVTLDGLNEFGLPYDIDNPRQVRADELSSVPIDLSNLPDNDVFFSFFYQPRGLSVDRPDPQDSLVLDFFNVNQNGWEKIWGIAGIDSIVALGDSFVFKNIRVPDSLQKNGFRFRFRNYSSSAGGFDQWHLDYFYLNSGRSVNDTAFNDISFIYDAPGLLKDYTAMPWFHFRTNPSLYMKDTTFTLVKNNSTNSLSVYNKVVIPDTVNNTIYYRFPSMDNFIFLPGSSQLNFTYPIDFDYSMSDIDSGGVFESFYDIDFRPGMTQEPDFIRSNDSVTGKTILYDYYAYDDGTAEAGYGINPAQSPDGFTAFMAVEFNIPFPDTIGGLRLYFLPQAADIQNQELELTVWNSLSPPNVIFSAPFRYNPQFTENNGYLTYYFDSLVVVNQTFYVGLKAIGERSLNIGYDLNINNRDKIFWSFDGTNWNSPSAGIRDGSLMMRPIFRRTGIGVGLKDSPLLQSDVTVYPNPTRERINIFTQEEEKIKEVILMDIRGKLIFRQAFKKTFDIGQLSPGVYFLQLISQQDQQITKKIIISP